MSSRVFLECHCSEKKSFRLTFDGGSLGEYVVYLCSKCNSSEDLSFRTHGQEIV